MKEITAHYDTVLQVVRPHFDIFSDYGFEARHLCITAINIDEGKTFGIDEAGGLLDQISSQSGVVAMVHNNDFHRYYVSARRALAMKIIASFSGIAGVIGLIPLVDIPLTFIVGDIMLSVLECLKVDENKSVEEYKERYSTGLVLGNAATVAMFVAGMVLDFTVLGILAGEAVGATTAVSSITALGVHAYDYFTEEESELEWEKREDQHGKSVEDLQKGVFDFVSISRKEREAREEQFASNTTESQKPGVVVGLGKFLEFLSWAPSSKVEVYTGEEEQHELLSSEGEGEQNLTDDKRRRETEPEEEDSTSRTGTGTADSSSKAEENRLLAFLSWKRNTTSATNEMDALTAQQEQEAEGEGEDKGEEKGEARDAFNRSVFEGLQQDLLNLVRREQRVEERVETKSPQEQHEAEKDEQGSGKEGAGFSKFFSFIHKGKLQTQEETQGREEVEEDEETRGGRENLAVESTSFGENLISLFSSTRFKKEEAPKTKTNPTEVKVGTGKPSFLTSFFSNKEEEKKQDKDDSLDLSSDEDSSVGSLKKENETGEPGEDVLSSDLDDSLESGEGLEEEAELPGDEGNSTVEQRGVPGDM
jgi:hypothetical protein